VAREIQCDMSIVLMDSELSSDCVAAGEFGITEIVAWDREDGEGEGWEMRESHRSRSSSAFWKKIGVIALTDWVVNAGPINFR